jgi:acyl-CoA synthetase (AMP-forming)/AMP-acid ligase II
MVNPRKVPLSLIRQFEEKGYWVGRTLFDFLVEAEKKHPDKTAVIYKDEFYTFADFKRISLHLASQLKKAGIGRGDIVSVQLPNCPQFMFLQIALSIIGAIIAPVHLVARKRDLYSNLNFCESKALVFQAAYGNRNYLEEYADIRQSVPSMRDLIVRGDIDGGALPPGAIPFESLTGNNRGSETVEPCTEANDIFYLNFTSGTEGDPKGFLHTFNTITSFAYGVGNDWKLSNEDTFLTLSPMTHTFGHTITYYCVMQGVKVVLVDKFEPGEALRTIDAEKVSVMQGTPAHIYGILDHESFPSFDIKSLRLIFAGGALVPKNLLLKVRKHFGAETLNGYGMGETLLHTVTRVDDPDWAKADTVGKAFGGSEVKIFEPTPSQDNPSILIGEVGYRGPFLFIEYFKNPVRTEETRDYEGWFRTGDVGYVDELGYLRITGRKKDQINRGGSKISPGEIEGILKFHPKIRDVAIVAMPDRVMGERCCAYVILQPDAGSLKLEELQAFLKEREVTPYKWPERLEISTEFPMTPTGKVRKEELRKMLLEKLANANQDEAR